jgi:hypothetical protein
VIEKEDTGRGGEITPKKKTNLERKSEAGFRSQLLVVSDLLFLFSHLAKKLFVQTLHARRDEKELFETLSLSS